MDEGPGQMVSAGQEFWGFPPGPDRRGPHQGDLDPEHVYRCRLPNSAGIQLPRPIETPIGSKEMLLPSS